MVRKQSWDRCPRLPLLTLSDTQFSIHNPVWYPGLPILNLFDAQVYDT